jgi:hypothetical protein
LSLERGEACGDADAEGEYYIGESKDDSVNERKTKNQEEE